MRRPSKPTSFAQSWPMLLKVSCALKATCLHRKLTLQSPRKASSRDLQGRSAEGHNQHAEQKQRPHGIHDETVSRLVELQKPIRRLLWRIVGSMICNQAIAKAENSRQAT